MLITENMQHCSILFFWREDGQHWWYVYIHALHPSISDIFITSTPKNSSIIEISSMKIWVQIFSKIP